MLVAVQAVNDLDCFCCSGERSSLPVFGCLCERDSRQTLANCEVSLPAPRLPWALLSFRKDQRMHVGNVNIVIPFVAAMSPVPPLLKCKIRSVF